MAGGAEKATDRAGDRGPAPDLLLSRGVEGPRHLHPQGPFSSTLLPGWLGQGHVLSPVRRGRHGGSQPRWVTCAAKPVRGKQVEGNMDVPHGDQEREGQVL